MTVINSIVGMLKSTHDISYTKQKLINESVLKNAKSLGIDTKKIIESINQNAIAGSSSKETKTDEKGYLKSHKYDEEYLKTINDAIKGQIENVTNSDYEYDGNLIEKWLTSDNECTDGKDDGKISFWSKVGNILEGAAKTIVGTVHNIFTDPKKLAITAISGLAIAGIACIPIVGPYIAAGIGIAGGTGLLVNGIKTIVKSAQRAEEATTDAEAKDAYEDIGEGGAESACGVAAIVLSVLGISGVSKGELSSIIKEKGLFKGLLEVIKNNGITQAELKRIALSSEDGVLRELLMILIDPGNLEPTS